MKIASVTDSAIIFDNGNNITYFHNPDCCEDNYADFSVINENVINYDYNFPEKLRFKFIEGGGFKFGDTNAWIFVPCYSEQNGYYSTEIDILYNNEVVLSGTYVMKW